MKEYFPFLRPDQILTSLEDKNHYGKDWLKDFTPNPSLVLLPASTEEVSQILKVCNEKNFALVPSGGRTGLSGGATAINGEIILSLDRMNRVLGVSEVDRLITVQAGVITQRIHEEANAHNLYFPVEFTTKGSSHIGGNVSTNAGGIRVVKYGNTRDWVVGMTAVTGSGEILRLNGSLFKNQTGYDLKSLLIGSEGTLGIITELTLKLISIPHERVRLLAAIPKVENIIELLRDTRQRFDGLSAFEFFTEGGLSKVLAHHPLTRPFKEVHPHYVLLEIERSQAESTDELLEFFSAKIEAGLIDDVVLSQSQKQADDLLSLRERIGETLSTHYSPHKNDISVPVPSIPGFVRELEALIKKEYPAFEVIVFGHIGDGNLHLNVLKPPSLQFDEFLKFCHEADKKIFTLVQHYKGSISAEHGVGLLKKEFLEYSKTPFEISLMRGIKSVFDPKGILNPGKIFDS